MSDRGDTLVWRGLDSWRAEFAHVLLRPDGLGASGVQLGVDPEPYRLEYSLEVCSGWLTERLEANAYGRGWWRALELVREPDGSWRCETGSSGSLDQPPPGGDLEPVDGARDCDLACSPLTNYMPVRREGLTRPDAEAQDFVMAWVRVPGLSVHRSEQRYEPIDARRVRYVGRHRDFEGELRLDEGGFVEHYPALAERVDGPL